MRTRSRCDTTKLENPFTWVVCKFGDAEQIAVDVPKDARIVYTHA